MQESFLGAPNPMTDDNLKITEKLTVPEREISFITSRSGGPGGQNVNKVSTQVTLRFDLNATNVFSDNEKKQIQTKLASRITADGILQITCRETRSQLTNRNLVVERFVNILRKALYIPPVRRKTKIPKSEKLLRLSDKKKISQRKQHRRKNIPADE
jgi:ribosome-associated protein